MITQKIVNNWQAEHFITYLFLAVADSDNETTEEELAVAHKRTKQIFKEYYSEGAESHDALFQEVQTEFKNNDVTERKHVIEALSKRIHLDEDVKTDLISDLNGLISSDDVVKDSEHRSVNYIRLLMSSN